MIRAVLDPNVVISALLSPKGAPARVLTAWIEGALELIVSPLLLAELERALAYPKLRKHITADEAGRAVEWLRRSATLRDDPAAPRPLRSSDPDDDYLIALAASEEAVLVSGDDHLLRLSRKLPVYRPAALLRLIEEE